VYARLVYSIALLSISGPALCAEPPDLSWLAGAWCHDDGKRSVEEHWLTERGGLMLGVNRTVTPRGAAFEFLRIELKRDAVRYVAQPGGAPPVAFMLATAAPQRVAFTNPAHDFPKRVQYWREAEVLRARVDDGTDEGTAEEFTWRRCTPAPRAAQLAASSAA
jgi:hypothetical protein